MGNSQSPKQLLVNQQYTFRTDAFNVFEKSPLVASHKFKGRKFERFRHCLDNVQLRFGTSLQSLPWLFRLCSHLSRIALAPAREPYQWLCFSILRRFGGLPLNFPRRKWIPFTTYARSPSQKVHSPHYICWIPWQKSVFLHTNKWVPPYLIHVSLIQ